jgi:hypothetical protein
MSEVGIKTVDGTRFVTPDRLAALVASGKVPTDRRIVTLDRGVTWIMASDALSVLNIGVAVPPLAGAQAPAVSGSNRLALPPSGGIPGLVLASFILSGLSALLLCFTGIPAVICAAIAMRKPESRRYAGLALGIAIAMTVASTIGWAVVSKLSSKYLDASSSPSMAPRSKVRGASEPDDQLRFLRIISESKVAYRDAPNEIGEVASRDARRRDLESAFPSSTVNGWVGRITEISTNMDGKGVLAISIGPDVTICTWNNAFSDLVSGTLIEKTSAVYSTLARLHVGNKVIVSGNFLRDNEDHFAEQSLTLAGSLTDPAFTFDFLSVEPAP